MQKPIRIKRIGSSSCQHPSGNYAILPVVIATQGSLCPRSPQEISQPRIFAPFLGVITIPSAFSLSLSLAVRIGHLDQKKHLFLETCWKRFKIEHWQVEGKPNKNHSTNTELVFTSSGWAYQTHLPTYHQPPNIAPWNNLTVTIDFSCPQNGLLNPTPCSEFCNSTTCFCIVFFQF